MNSIRAREQPISLTYAQEGGLCRLQEVDEESYSKLFRCFQKNSVRLI